MNRLEKLFVEGKLEIWTPDSNTKTIKQILRKPDVIYVVRKQTERKG